MKLNSVLVRCWLLVYFLFSPYLWAHQINMSHCETDTFTNEVSRLKCDQEYILDHTLISKLRL